MAGTAISNFADFVKSTGPQFYSSAEHLLNEAVMRSYSLKYFVKGKEMSKVIQGGSKIRDEVMFDEANTRQRYKPNAEFTWSQPQVLTEQEVNWRFAIDHMSWTDQEVELNIDERLPDQYVEVQYKNLKKKIERRMWTSSINGQEKDLWKNPHSAAEAAEMEAAGGQDSYSIPAFITENVTAGVNPYLPIGWTTIMGISPANEVRWRNPVERYTLADIATNLTTSLLPNLDRIWLDTRFEAPPLHKDAFEPSTDPTSNQAIFTSKAGINNYKVALRGANDRTAQPQDAAYPHVTYSGLPLVYVELLDGGRTDGLGAVFTHSNAVAAYDELGLGTDGVAVGSAKLGPRYYFINGNYMSLIYHRTRYFYQVDPYRMPKQPFTWVSPTDCWDNLFCNSRQRHGILAIT